MVLEHAEPEASVGVFKVKLLSVVHLQQLHWRPFRPKKLQCVSAAVQPLCV